MTPPTNDGGPAFPHAEFTEEIPNGIRVYQPRPGMSLRDYFAAKAMHAYLSNENDSWEPRSLASESYVIADAMLAARNQTTK